MDERSQLIAFYHFLGMTQNDILIYLSMKGIILISKRYLKRPLQSMDLQRRAYSKIGELDFLS